jgi:hypothetical protein
MGGGFETETWVQLVPSNVQVSFSGPFGPNPPKRMTVLLHMPPLHVPPGQRAHALPRLPHALGALPARHWPNVEQHPAQDVGPQALDVDALVPAGELMVVRAVGAVADLVDVVEPPPGAGELRSSAVLAPHPDRARVKTRASGEAARTMALSVRRPAGRTQLRTPNPRRQRRPRRGPAGPRARRPARRAHCGRQIEARDRELPKRNGLGFA